MKMKLSDFLSQYLVERGIKYNFTVPGGGAMHLNASFGHQPGLKNIYVQHEQSAAIAAEAYYRMSNELPLVCCTTGPGGTNTLTGVLGSWLDSIPLLVISGQVRFDRTVRSTGYPMRIFGDQEFDIVKVVKPMTKYAVMVNNPQMIKYHVDKAICLARQGRPGPVWLDIPQDIQSAVIDTEMLIPFDEKEVKNMSVNMISGKTIEIIREKLEQSRRPVVLAGVEIRTAGAYELFLRVIRKLNVPVVTSFDGIDLLEESDHLYAGRAGDIGNRFGNWAVQNSDFLLVIGSRLGVRQVSYATDTWARESFVVMVHPDPLELTKQGVHVELPIRSGPLEFLHQLDKELDKPLKEKSDWLDICRAWKEKYPVVSKERHYAPSDYVNAYCFINEFSKYSPENTPIVSGNGTACVVSGSALLIKKGQRFIINSGCASMGYDLPAAIGASFAINKGETICLAGDGSIQMNLQELQTIVFHKLPIKIFVINNGGYHSMRLTQRNLFGEMSLVGVGPESGDLGFPDMEKIAQAYGIPYTAIRRNDELEGILKKIFSKDGFCMCEVFVDTVQAFEPKPSAMKLPDGRIVSPPLEDLAPFLPREELKNIMIIPLVENAAEIEWR